MTSFNYDPYGNMTKVYDETSIGLQVAPAVGVSTTGGPLYKIYGSDDAAPEKSGALRIFRGGWRRAAVDCFW